MDGACVQLDQMPADNRIWPPSGEYLMLLVSTFIPTWRSAIFFFFS